VKVLSASLALDKDYLPAILELTDLYRKNNRQKEAQKLLEKSSGSKLFFGACSSSFAKFS